MFYKRKKVQILPNLLVKKICLKTFNDFHTYLLARVIFHLLTSTTVHCTILIYFFIFFPTCCRPEIQQYILLNSRAILACIFYMHARYIY